MSYKKKTKIPKRMPRRQMLKIDMELDKNLRIMLDVYEHKFTTYGGKPSNCQRVADYLRDLPCNTRFFNSNICRATGLTPTQLYEVKRNRLIKRAFKVMQIDPEYKSMGWRKIF